MDEVDLNQQVAAAARDMAEEKSTVGTLNRAVRMATDIIANCDVAGVSVVTPDGVETPAASGEELRRIDELQYELGEGPCFVALHSEDVVTSTDLASDDRWPRWGPRIADEVGVRSSISFRLFTTGDDLGALNLYSRHPNGFRHDDVTDGLIVAAHAAVALAATLREDQLGRALHSRTVIGQAVGILMERFDIDADHAFDVLRRVSSHTNTKLFTVARQLVETRHLPDS